MTLGINNSQDISLDPQMFKSILNRMGITLRPLVEGSKIT